MFFKEILGSNAKLSHIVAFPYEFLFSELPGLSGTMVLITSGANYFLKKSLEKFTNLLTFELLDDIKNQLRIDTLTERLDETVTKAFPYLLIEKGEEDDDS